MCCRYGSPNVQATIARHLKRNRVRTLDALPADELVSLARESRMDRMSRHKFKSEREMLLTLRRAEIQAVKTVEQRWIFP